jgi:hypothetical protein
MKYIAIAAISLFLTGALAETVKTTDGRTIILNKDGTYEIVSENEIKPQLVIKSHLFEHNISKYKQKSIRFMPIITNESDEKIIAVKFHTQFLNPFGDIVMEFNGESEAAIPPRQTSETSLFYVFEDNQFMNGQPYDKLLSMVTNGTGKIVTKPKAIVFEGGKIVKF